MPLRAGMKQLWAPWRMEYILSPKPDTCVFCIPPHSEEDEQRLVLYRGQHSFVIMNAFPYNCGHVMVTPFRHVMNLQMLTEGESSEIMLLLRHCSIILQDCFHCQGQNLGLNIGEAAGAGIREHLHFHVVPRWNGDSSFMAVMDEARIMPEHLRATYARLKPHFAVLYQRSQAQ